MIEGVVISPLKRIPDERGSVMHILKASDSACRDFGEVYCSTIYPGVVKGWHLHKVMTLNYVVIRGTIKFVLYDVRAKSPTQGEVQEISMGDRNYVRVTVPPGVWNGFQGVGTEEAYVINVTDMSHDPSEIERADPFTKDIPYSWPLKHR
ncbi:MAG: dTDP-4-dehydrorhamnose 3,5-epimerase family protein [bacterium]